MAGPVIDIFMVYMFLKRLVTPFDKTEAYKLGLIDADGKRLKKASTPAEKAAMGYFDRLIFNLKRLLATVPGGKSQLASFAAALLLLREHDERLNTDTEYLHEEFRKTLARVDMNLYEEVMGTGPGVAGTGGGPGGDPTSNPADWVRVHYPTGWRGRGRPKTLGLPINPGPILRRKRTMNEAVPQYWSNKPKTKKRFPYASKSSGAGNGGDGSGGNGGE